MIDKDHIIELRKQGKTYQVIADELGCSKQYVGYVCLQYKRDCAKAQKKVRTPVENKNYTNLIVGIIQKAADDYFDLMTESILPTTSCNVAEIEKFFHSELYHLMTNIDGDYILNRLKREAVQKITIEYIVKPDDNQEGYYVCHIGEEHEPLSRTYASRDLALHKAAQMQGLRYNLYIYHLRKERLYENRI